MSDRTFDYHVPDEDELVTRLDRIDAQLDMLGTVWKIDEQLEMWEALQEIDARVTELEKRESRRSRLNTDTDWDSEAHIEEMRQALSQQHGSDDSQEFTSNLPLDEQSVAPGGSFRESMWLYEDIVEMELDVAEKRNLEMYERRLGIERREKLRGLGINQASAPASASAPAPLPAPSPAPSSTHTHSTEELSTSTTTIGSTSEESGESPSKRRRVEVDWSPWTKPDATGWESAADYSRLQPEAIQLVIDFFQKHPRIPRRDFERFALGANNFLDRSSHQTGEAVGAPVMRAYPSEFQFVNSYTVEVMDISAVNRARMTLFHFTFEKFHQNHLTAAKCAYGDFVPDYTYAGQVRSPAGEDSPIYVWRIECSPGRPFLADAHRLALRQNREKLVGILKHFADFVFEPLARAGDDIHNGKTWARALYNPLIDANNIVVRPDWSGIVGILLWPPAVDTLPFGASLCGLLFMAGVPDIDDSNLHDHVEYGENAADDSDDEDGDDGEGRDANRNGYVGEGEKEYPTPGSFPQDEDSVVAEAYGDESWHVVDRFPLHTQSRNVFELDRICLRHLQAKSPLLASGAPQCWKDVFVAMRTGVNRAAGPITRSDREQYFEQIGRMQWDWFLHGLERNLSVDERAPEGGGGREDAAKEDDDPQEEDAN